MEAIKIVAMIGLVGAGAFLLMIASADDRSINWMNIAIAGACFIGAVLLRPKRTNGSQ
jgi:hypothetical protein